MRIEHPEYVTAQESVSLHDHAIREYGGRPGIRDAGRLLSCLALPNTLVFGVERFPTIHEKAAAYCFFISENQPFVDGNKRTGFLVALHFLLKNNLAVTLDRGEAYRIILSIAEGKTGIEELFSLFECAIANSIDGLH